MRKLLISIVFLLHITGVLWWNFPPYADFILSEPPPAHAASRYERKLFAWLRDHENSLPARLWQGYIDYLGAHQYWDFFAPEAPVSHRYLTVCEEIMPSGRSAPLPCPKPLYTSYDGTLYDAVKSFNGKRSRSFRFSENLVKFARPDLFDRFTRYWIRNNGAAHHGQGTTAYLILTEFLILPRAEDPHTRHLREDRVLWSVRR
ncbi:MAG: hypothetical protein ACREV4_01855 [Gammaproteobacteria bacterium]